MLNILIDTVIKLWYNTKPNQKKQVCLGIVKLDVIGDFFVWSYNLEAIIRHYKKNSMNKVILVAEASWANLANQLYPFDEVISIQRAKFRMNLIYRIKILSNLSQYKFDSILKPTYTRELSLEESVIRFVKAKNKIGYLPKYQGNEWRLWEFIAESWFDFKVQPVLMLKSEFEKNAFFVESIGIKTKSIRLGTFSFIMENSKIDKPYFVISPGATVGKRRWEANKYAELINLIHVNTNLICVICGSKADIDFVTGIKSGINNHSKIIDITGKTSLHELLGVIKRSEILIGNESAGIHIAAAVGTKSVCILGGGHFGRFMPYPKDLIPSEFRPVPVFEYMPCYNCDWKCQYSLSYNKTVPCIEKVSVEQVFNVFTNHFKKK